MAARGTIIAIVAVLVVVVIIVAVAAVVLLRPVTPPKKPISIELWYNSDGHYGDTEAAVAQVLKSQLEKSGLLTVNLKSSAWAQYTQQFSRGQLPFFLLGWFPDYPDSDDYVTPFLTSGGAKSLGSYYNSSEMEALIKQETSGAASGRVQAFSQIQDKLATDVPYIPLWQGIASSVADPTVTGVILDPFLFRYSFIGKAGVTTFTMSTTDKITNLDGALEYDLFSGTVVGNIFDTLYTTTPTDGTKSADLIPLLADGMPSNPTGDTKVWQVKLKPGLKFSNGDPITALDVKFSFERVMTINDPASASFLFTDIMDSHKINEAITCPGDPTCSGLVVQFNLNQSYTLFPQLLTFSTAAVVNHRVFTSPTETMKGIAVKDGAGSGPYTVDTANSDKATRVSLKANPNYNFKTFWADKGGPATVPASPTFQITIKSDATALKQDIQTHSVLLAYRSLNPTDIKALQGDATLKVTLGSSPQIRYLVFNVKTPPFNDPNLRKAISYLVNRQEISSTVFQGLTQPLWSMIPPGWLGYKPVYKDVYGESPNIDKAKQLLDQVKTTFSVGDLLAAVARE